MMKKFEIPAIEAIRFAVEDVITTSGNYPTILGPPPERPFEEPLWEGDSCLS